MLAICEMLMISYGLMCESKRREKKICDYLPVAKNMLNIL